jgi:hypothetical protein
VIVFCILSQSCRNTTGLDISRRQEGTDTMLLIWPVKMHSRNLEFIHQTTKKDCLQMAVLFLCVVSDVVVYHKLQNC